MNQVFFRDLQKSSLLFSFNLSAIILGDPGADSGGEGKSKREEKYGTKKSKERREEPLGTMSYQTSSKLSPPFWLLIGARKLVYTEGDILPNMINFQVPRVGIWPKKMLKNLNATPSPVPLCPSIQTLLPALLDSILNQIFAFGMPFTMNYGEPIDNYLRLFHGFLKRELKINFTFHLYL